MPVPHAPGLLLALGTEGPTCLLRPQEGKGWLSGLGGCFCAGEGEGAVKPGLGFRAGFLGEVMPELKLVGLTGLVASGREREGCVSVKGGQGT